MQQIFARRNLFIALLGFATGLLAFFALRVAQRDGKRNLQPYYYPVESLHSGRVYEYESLQGDSTDHEFWYMRTFETDTGVFLSSTQYNRLYQIEQMVLEKIVANGSLARSLNLYEFSADGTQHKIATSIDAPNVFPFSVTDSSGIFLYKLHYYLPGDDAHKIYLIRNRKFGGDRPDFMFEGEKHPCVRFTLREVAGSEGEGSAEGEAEGEEWYAKGIGLVYFKKVWGKGQYKTIREFRLINTFPMSELEKRAARE